MLLSALLLCPYVVRAARPNGGLDRMEGWVGMCIGGRVLWLGGVGEAT